MDSLVADLPDNHYKRTRSSCDTLETFLRTLKSHRQTVPYPAATESCSACCCGNYSISGKPGTTWQNVSLVKHCITRWSAACNKEMSLTTDLRTSVGCWCTMLCGNPGLVCRGGILIVVGATCFTFNGIVFSTRVFVCRGCCCCCCCCCDCCCCWDSGAGAMLRNWGLTNDCAILIVLAVVLPWDVDCNTATDRGLVNFVFQRCRYLKTGLHKLRISFTRY